MNHATYAIGLVIELLGIALMIVTISGLHPSLQDWIVMSIGWLILFFGVGFTEAAKRDPA